MLHKYMFVKRIDFCIDVLAIMSKVGWHLNG